MRPWCAVPTSEKFIVQLPVSAVVIRQAGAAQNMFMSRSLRFLKGCVTFAEHFTGKGTSPTNHCWCQKTRVIALSCGIKISAVHHLVLSQYIHLTDRRTDGRTNGQTELRQQYRALHYMQSRGKNECNSLKDGLTEVILRYVGLEMEPLML